MYHYCYISSLMYIITVVLLLIYYYCKISLLLYIITVISYCYIINVILLLLYIINVISLFLYIITVIYHYYYIIIYYYCITKKRRIKSRKRTSITLHMKFHANNATKCIGQTLALLRTRTKNTDGYNYWSFDNWI